MFERGYYKFIWVDWSEAVRLARATMSCMCILCIIIIRQMVCVYIFHKLGLWLFSVFWFVAPYMYLCCSCTHFKYQCSPGMIVFVCVTYADATTRARRYNKHSAKVVIGYTLDNFFFIAPNLFIVFFRTLMVSNDCSFIEIDIFCCCCYISYDKLG